MTRAETITTTHPSAYGPYLDALEARMNYRRRPDLGERNAPEVNEFVLERLRKIQVGLGMKPLTRRERRARDRRQPKGNMA